MILGSSNKISTLLRILTPAISNTRDLKKCKSRLYTLELLEIYKSIKEKVNSEEQIGRF